MGKGIPIKRGESGVALVVVTIVLLVAALIIPPLLSVNFSGNRSSQIHENKMLELYAADAGVEDALYQIQNGEELELTGISDLHYGEIYYPETPSMNDSDLTVTVEKVWLPEGLGYDTPIENVDPLLDTDKSDQLVIVGMLNSAMIASCSDNFESGDFVGGNGWLNDDPWNTLGDCSVIDAADACQGDWHMGFRRSSGEANRVVDLSRNASPHLQFYARAGNFEPGDSVNCRIRDDGPGGNLTVVKTWAVGDDDDICSAVDIDLSPFTMATDFTISFDADLSGGTVASEDFENGGFDGGSGWLGSWTHNGDCSVLNDGRQHSGNYHLRLRRGNGYAKRDLDIAGHDGAKLRFWASVRSFESGDRAWLKIFDGANWHNARDWSKADSDDKYHPYDIDLSLYPYVGPGDYAIAFDADMNSSYDYFYVDDIEIIDYSYFYVDDLKIAEEGNVYKIEVAYTDASLGEVWMDRFGVWLPPGFEYVEVVESNGISTDDPVETPSYRGGTALEWKFDGAPIKLNDPPGVIPAVRDITLRFKPSNAPKGIFAWIRANEKADGSGVARLSWDTSCEIYKATSTASHSLSGTSTSVEAYVVQGELNKQAITSFGNYLATGAPLLIDEDKDGSEVKEWALDPLNPGTWTTVDSVFYDGRATISGIPDDAEVVAAWLYWSAFVKYADWSAPDETVDFMYPKRYYAEILGEALDGNGNDILAGTVNFPVVTLPQEEKVYMTPKRYRGESLGTVGANNTETYYVDNSPIITLPRAEYVFLNGSNLLTSGVDYEIDYAIGNVTVINDALSGDVTIDYSASGFDYLERDVDYSIDYGTGQVTITDDAQVGNVLMDYTAETWELNVAHEAYNKYGMEMDPAEQEVSGCGWSYACFTDVSNLVEGSGSGEFAVRNVGATGGNDAGSCNQKCYSGWSLIVVYTSEGETAHQFYLYDPIHDPAGTPFHSDKFCDIDFTLEDFYPPDGTVEGSLTYFVGEGDDATYEGDYIELKGASQPLYTRLSDPPINPADNAMNAKSTGGEVGVDIDTFEIIAGDINIGSDTEANVRFHTEGDRWYLVYMILSFKTDITITEDYSFTVGTLSYTYNYGG